MHLRRLAPVIDPVTGFETKKTGINPQSKGGSGARDVGAIAVGESAVAAATPAHWRGCLSLIVKGVSPFHKATPTACAYIDLRSYYSSCEADVPRGPL
jgi:hypothetical protein